MKEEKKRLIPVAAVVSLAYVIMDIVFLGRDFLAAGLFPDFALPAVCLLASFHRPQPDIRKDYLQAAALVVCLLSMFPFWPCHPMGLPLKVVAGPLAILSLMICEAVSLDVRRYSKVSRLFRNEAIWSNVIRDSRAFYFALMSLVICLDFLSFTRIGQGVPMPGIIADCLALALYGLGIARVVTGHTYYMSPSHEDELKSLLRGHLRTREVAEGVRERKMKVLYKKVLEYFEEKKPYLDEEVSLDDISRSLFTNKAYLSKTVNVLSGQNFRQFVNYYRVEYAIELIRRDPHLKVEELAMMSGFHNPVSFNMAFRLFKGKTPSEWIHEHRASLR